jgi:hypothetical protein
MENNIKAAMRKAKFGIPNLEEYLQVMKNAGLILVDFIFAQLNKFIVYLVLKIMK